MGTEQIIFDAILSGDTDKAKGKVSCNLAASHFIFCPRCNTVLDQSDTVVIEDNETLENGWVSCGDCYDGVSDILTETIKTKKLNVSVFDGRELFKKSRKK